MNIKNLEKNKKESRGFTLIETIVAIFILVIAITGPMSAAQNSLKASFLARDQVVAFYLAQDAIEYLKNYKDENIVNSVEKIISPSTISKCENNPCELNTLAPNSQVANIDSCQKDEPTCGQLYFYNIDKTYSPDSQGGVLSKFKRQVYIREIVTDLEYSVTVVIKWKSNFFTEREIVVQENLYNWLPN